MDLQHGKQQNMCAHSVKYRRAPPNCMHQMSQGMERDSAYIRITTPPIFYGTINFAGDKTTSKTHKKDNEKEKRNSKSYITQSFKVQHTKAMSTPKDHTKPKVHTPKTKRTGYKELHMLRKKIPRSPNR